MVIPACPHCVQGKLVSQARPFPSCSADRFQYAARANTESDRCCGTERVWLARLRGSTWWESKNQQIRAWVTNGHVLLLQETISWIGTWERGYLNRSTQWTTYSYQSSVLVIVGLVPFLLQQLVSSGKDWPVGPMTHLLNNKKEQHPMYKVYKHLFLHNHACREGLRDHHR